jgi:hypothetical protein
LELPGVDVRILDVGHYLGEKSIHKLAKRYEVPHSCIFPTKMRRKKFSSSDLPKCPELEMFSHILDTSEMAECSKKFQESFKGPWNFLTQLKTFSDETCNIAMTAICRYIEFCYEIQDEILRWQKLIVQPKKKTNLCTVIHSLKEPLVTMDSCLNFGKHCVCPPKHYMDYLMNSLE